MGCKINKGKPLVEDSIQDVPKGDEKLENPSDIVLNNLNAPPIITNEKDIRFKASELVGEKKGSILDHYTFEKDLGAGIKKLFFINLVVFCRYFLSVLSFIVFSCFY